MLKIRLKYVFLIFVVLCQMLSAKDLKIVYASRMRDVLGARDAEYARLATLLKKYRKTDDVVFIFGGHSLGPSPISTMDKGAHIISILNILKPDVFGVSHGDMVFSLDEVSLRAQEAGFPMVLTNVTYEDGSRLSGISPRTIIEKAGVKIGVISLFSADYASKYNLTNGVVADFQKSIIENSKILKKQGADIVVLCTREHFKVPVNFVRDGIVDLVLSKDAYFPEATKSDRFVILDKQSEVAVIDVKKDNFLVKKENLLDYEKDEEIDSLVARYKVKIDSFLSHKIGTTKVFLSTKRSEVRSEENVFANVLADAMRQYTKADIALINGGSIRGNRVYKAGSVLTRKDMHIELPFRNKLVLIKAKGKTILEVLEHGLSDLQNHSGNFLHISGGKIIYDSSLKPNNRVRKVLIDGKELKANDTYSLVIQDFIYKGGDGFVFKDVVEIKEYKLNLRFISDILTDYVIQKKVIDAHLEGRLQDLAKQKK